VLQPLCNPPHLAPCEAAATAVDGNTEGGTGRTPLKVVAQRAAAAAAGDWAAVGAAAAAASLP
jgi:hypothetical protein